MMTIIQLFNDRGKVKIKISQMWTNALPLESVHKLASIDSAHISVIALTDTRRCVNSKVLLVIYIAPSQY